MPVIASFDGANKIITEVSVSGDTTFDVSEIYSEWKAWVRLSDNSKFLQAFSTIGGDPITASTSISTTYFLENGWRYRPAERSHKVTLVGNIFTREEGQSVFVSTVGNFNVSAQVTVSSDVTTVATGSALTTDQANDLKLVKRILANRSVITEAGGGAKDIDLFSEDDTTLIGEWSVSADGLTRTRVT